MTCSEATLQASCCACLRSCPCFARQSTPTSASSRASGRPSVPHGASRTGLLPFVSSPVDRRSSHLSLLLLVLTQGAARGRGLRRVSAARTLTPISPLQPLWHQDFTVFETTCMCCLGCLNYSQLTLSRSLEDAVVGTKEVTAENNLPRSLAEATARMKDSKVCCSPLQSAGNVIDTSADCRRPLWRGLRPALLGYSRVGSEAVPDPSHRLGAEALCRNHLEL